MSKPLMAKATAVWLVDNTTLSFKQIADFCGLHILEVQAIADDTAATKLTGRAARPEHKTTITIDGKPITNMDELGALELTTSPTEVSCSRAPARCWARTRAAT